MLITPSDQLAVALGAPVDDGTVQIWDWATREEQAALTGHGGQVRALAVAPCGSWLATGSDDGTAQIWDTANWRPNAMMRIDGAISSCAWLGSTALAIAGAAGLYAFDFATDSAAASAGRGHDRSAARESEKQM